MHERRTRSGDRLMALCLSIVGLGGIGIWVAALVDDWGFPGFFFGGFLVSIGFGALLGMRMGR